jgi:hypothetical protein
MARNWLQITLPNSGVNQPKGRAYELQEEATRDLPSVQLQRLSTEQAQAQRAQLARELMAQQQAGQRQLLSQQAKSGVRGGAAVAQQAQLAARLAAQRAAQEEQGMLGRQMFDIEQAQKEQFANVANELARRQMLIAAAGQEQGLESARALARAQKAAARRR